MGRIAQPEHGAYSLNVCPAFESRGFAPVLLAFVLGNVFFSFFFLQLFLAHGSSTLANLLSVQKPKHIRDRLRKWWKQGDVVWSASTLRFKTLLACCSTVVLAFACASYQTQVDALGSRLRFRSASRTLVNAVKECFYGCNCRPYAKSTFSPVLDCQTRTSWADGLLLQEKCTSPVELFGNEF